MNSIKQLRIRIINGVNSDGEIVYSEGFDLMDLVELQQLKKICKSCIIDGFRIEISDYHQGEYKGPYGKNEFQPFKEYIHAAKNKNSFIFHGDMFAILPHQIIRESILDINNDISFLLKTIVPGDIETTLKEMTEIFELEEQGKNPKIACFA